MHAEEIIVGYLVLINVLGLAVFGFCLLRCLEEVSGLMRGCRSIGIRPGIGSSVRGSLRLRLWSMEGLFCLDGSFRFCEMG